MLQLPAKRVSFSPVKTRILLALVLSALLGFHSSASTAQAEGGPHGIRTYEPNLVIGDGKDGRVFAKWTQGVENKPIDSILAQVERVRGGRDTFVNLRFENGDTLDNGKRMFLDSDGAKTVRWNVNNQQANGKPLVMNAYNGEVRVRFVTVRYQGASANPIAPANPIVPPRPANNASSPSEAAAIERCRELRRMRNPRITVGEVRSSGGLFSGKYRISGAISGQCVEEVGYYENGRLVKEIDFPLSDRFDRKNFSMQVRTGREGELRIFTSDGREDVVNVEKEISNR